MYINQLNNLAKKLPNFFLNKSNINSNRNNFNKKTVMLVCIMQSVYQLIYRFIKHNSIFCYKNYFFNHNQ